MTPSPCSSYGAFERVDPGTTSSSRGESSVDATRRCLGGTSTLSDPEALFTTLRLAEMPDNVGLIKARENKEEGMLLQLPPQEQRKTDEPTATWQDKNSALTLQPNSGQGDHEAAEG
ncbi:hypothetical protein NDU88_001620 [Pleurodeles waltl]|uniref:Uncharacterized protein n=1 Tax=Pleurodeles waltl TaxID=8319 RepID=A0AAV7TIS7_PLEWA|nr:hypothetical protein NDU88_001620 [Pleurodeles waltl]